MTTYKHIKGGEDLQKFLEQLPPKMEANVMRSALRAGAVVIKDQAKSNVSVVSGKLRDGIVVGTRSRRGIVKATISAKGPHGFLARWIEYGTAAHYIKPKAAKSLFFAGLFSQGLEHPGSSAKPFMRPALDQRAQEALAAVAQAIKKRLTKQGLNGVGAVDV